MRLLLMAGAIWLGCVGEWCGARSFALFLFRSLSLSPSRPSLSCLSVWCVRHVQEVRTARPIDEVWTAPTERDTARHGREQEAARQDRGLPILAHRADRQARYQTSEVSSKQHTDRSSSTMRRLIEVEQDNETSQVTMRSHSPKPNNQTSQVEQHNETSHSPKPYQKFGRASSSICTVLMTLVRSSGRAATG